MISEIYSKSNADQPAKASDQGAASGAANAPSGDLSLTGVADSKQNTPVDGSTKQKSTPSVAAYREIWNQMEPPKTTAGINPDFRIEDSAGSVKKDVPTNSPATESVPFGSDKVVAASSSSSKVISFEPAALTADKVTSAAPAVSGIDKVTSAAPAVSGIDKVTSAAPAVSGADKVTATAPAVSGTDKVTSAVPAVSGTDKVTSIAPTLAVPENVIGNTLVAQVTDKVSTTSPAVSATDKLASSTPAISLTDKVTTTNAAQTAIDKGNQTTPTVSETDKIVSITPSVAVSDKLVPTTPSAAVSDKIVSTIPTVPVSDKVVSTTPTVPATDRLTSNTSDAIVTDKLTSTTSLGSAADKTNSSVALLATSDKTTTSAVPTVTSDKTTTSAVPTVTADKATTTAATAVTSDKTTTTAAPVFASDKTNIAAPAVLADKTTTIIAPTVTADKIDSTSAVTVLVDKTSSSIAPNMVAADKATSATATAAMPGSTASISLSAPVLDKASASASVVSALDKQTDSPQSSTQPLLVTLTRVPSRSEIDPAPLTESTRSGMNTVPATVLFEAGAKISMADHNQTGSATPFVFAREAQRDDTNTNGPSHAVADNQQLTPVRSFDGSAPTAAIVTTKTVEAELGTLVKHSSDPTPGAAVDHVNGGAADFSPVNPAEKTRSLTTSLNSVPLPTALDHAASPVLPQTPGLPGLSKLPESSTNASTIIDNKSVDAYLLKQQGGHVITLYDPNAKVARESDVTALPAELNRVLTPVIADKVGATPHAEPVQSARNPQAAPLPVYRTEENREIPLDAPVVVVAPSVASSTSTTSGQTNTTSPGAVSSSSGHSVNPGATSSIAPNNGPSNVAANSVSPSTFTSPANQSLSVNQPSPANHMALTNQPSATQNASASSGNTALPMHSQSGGTVTADQGAGQSSAAHNGVTYGASPAAPSHGSSSNNSSYMQSNSLSTHSTGIGATYDPSSSPSSSFPFPFPSPSPSPSPSSSFSVAPSSGASSSSSSSSPDPSTASNINLSANHPVTIFQQQQHIHPHHQELDHHLHHRVDEHRYVHQVRQFEAEECQQPASFAHLSCNDFGNNVLEFRSADRKETIEQIDFNPNSDLSQSATISISSSLDDIITIVDQTVKQLEAEFAQLHLTRKEELEDEEKRLELFKQWQLDQLGLQIQLDERYRNEVLETARRKETAEQLDLEVAKSAKNEERRREEIERSKREDQLRQRQEEEIRRLTETMLAFRSAKKQEAIQTRARRDSEIKEQLRKEQLRKEQQRKEQQRKELLSRRDNKRDTYVVQPKDTVERIALRKIGSVELVSLLYSLNKTKIQVKLDGNKQVFVVRVGTVLWLPTRKEVREFRQRQLLQRSQQVPGAAVLRSVSTIEEVRRMNVEKLLGPICGTQQCAELTYRVRLGDTLRSISLNHPALGDVGLWKLLAKKNRLSVHSDKDGRPIAQLKRGDIVILPSLTEIAEYQLESGEIEHTVSQRSSAVSFAPLVDDTVYSGSVKTQLEAASPLEDVISCLVDSLSEDCQMVRSVVQRNRSRVNRTQLEVRRNAEWLPVLTYEISDHELKRHEFTLVGAKKSMLIDLPFNVAQEMIDHDLKVNWVSYAEKFLIRM